jgi:transcriptional regulator with XRE-family HTH domain
MAKKQGKTAAKTKSDPDLLRLGRRIRALRIKRGYKSGEKFALDHNLSRVHYGRWETGKKNITYKSLLMLAKAFKISLSEFFREDVE